MPQPKDNVDFDDNSSTFASITDNNNNSSSSFFSADSEENSAKEGKTEAIVSQNDNDNTDFVTLTDEISAHLENIKTINSLAESISSSAPDLLSQLVGEYNSLKDQKNSLEENQSKINTELSTYKSLISGTNGDLDDANIDEATTQFFKENIKNKSDLEKLHEEMKNVVETNTVNSDNLNTLPDDFKDFINKFATFAAQDNSETNVLYSLLTNNEFDKNEFDKLKTGTQEFINKYKELKDSADYQQSIIVQVLGGDEYDKDAAASFSPELKNLITDYIQIRQKISSVDDKISKLKSDVLKIQQYLEDFGLKNQPHPEVSQDFEGLLKSIDNSSKKIEENSRVKLYMNISDALSNGKSDQLPQELLDLIHHLVVDRLESITKPYEELSSKYVSGVLTHEQFTDQIGKNAIFSLLREKLIEDIIREYENNNLSSNVIPMRMKLATERMINDAKGFGSIITTDKKPESPVFENPVQEAQANDPASSGLFTQ